MAEKLGIFDNAPGEGKPLSLPGLADGLSRMAKAWETLNIEGGAVEWYNGSPKIVVPRQRLVASQGLSALGEPGLFKVVSLVGWTLAGGDWTMMTVAEMVADPPEELWTGSGPSGNYLRPTWDYPRLHSEQEVEEE